MTGKEIIRLENIKRDFIVGDETVHASSVADRRCNLRDHADQFPVLERAVEINHGAVALPAASDILHRIVVERRQDGAEPIGNFLHFRFGDRLFRHDGDASHDSRGNRADKAEKHAEIKHIHGFLIHLISPLRGWRMLTEDGCHPNGRL